MGLDSNNPAAANPLPPGFGPRNTPLNAEATNVCVVYDDPPSFPNVQAKPMRAALTMLGIIIGVGCESHGRPWTRSRSLCSSPDYESRDRFVNYHPGRDDRQRRADWISGVSTLTVDDAHEIERRVSNITRVSFASRVVLQATHENKNWSTVVLDASNAGIARNCWGARSCQRSTPCVLKKIVSR